MKSMRILKSGSLALAILFAPLACFNKSPKSGDIELNSETIPKYESEMREKIVSTSLTNYEDLIKKADAANLWLTSESYKGERAKVETYLKNDLLKTVLRTYQRAGHRSKDLKLIQAYISELTEAERQDKRFVRMACQAARESRQFDFCIDLLKEQTSQEEAWIEAEKAEILYQKGELKESLAGLKRAHAGEADEYEKRFLSLRIAEVQVSLGLLKEAKENLGIYYGKDPSLIEPDLIFKDLNDSLILIEEKKYSESWTRLDDLRKRILEKNTGPFFPEILTNYYRLINAVLLKDEGKIKTSKEQFASSLIDDPTQEKFRIGLKIIDDHLAGKDTQAGFNKLKELQNGESVYSIQLKGFLAAASAK